MDYNEYNSNGNKKKINISGILGDRQKRAWLILSIYLLFIFILIAMVRSSYSNSNVESNKDSVSNNKELKDQKSEVNNEILKEEKDELDNLFSFIDQNNYNFDFVLNYNNDEYITKGKRYNNKFEFSYSNKEQSISFIGTETNLKMKKDDSYINIVFPYTYFNYFDNNLIKKIIRDSSYNEINKTYEITSSKLNNLLNLSKEENDLSINTIELETKNNRVVGIKIDFSNALKQIDSTENTAKISLNYSNFGLIDDFNASFE